MRQSNKEHGQSLFEVIFALAIAAAVLVAIISAATKTVNTSTGNAARSSASTLVQETSEWLRGQRDTDYDTFASYAGTSESGTLYCLQILGADMTSLVSGTCTAKQTVNGKFIREVRLTLTSPTQVDADILVTWTDSSGIHESRSVVTFTDWRAR